MAFSWMGWSGRPPLKRSHLNKHLSKVREPTRRESMKNVPGRGISVKALNRKKLDRVKEEQGGPCGWRKIKEKSWEIRSKVTRSQTVDHGKVFRENGELFHKYICQAVYMEWSININKRTMCHKIIRIHNHSSKILWTGHFWKLMIFFFFFGYCKGNICS